MKRKKINLIALGLAAIYALAACGDKDDDQDHDEHDHKDHKEKAHNDDKHKDGGHDEQDHEKVIAGPNGGRVLTVVEPHAEFLVTDDRKVQIAFVDDDIKLVPAAAQVVTVIAGDRSNPTNLSFEKKGDVLIRGHCGNADKSSQRTTNKVNIAGDRAGARRRVDEAGE